MKDRIIMPSAVAIAENSASHQPTPTVAPRAVAARAEPNPPGPAEIGDEGRRWRFSLTEGLVLTSLPVLAYAWAYRYETGACEFYGLPPEVIDLSMWQVIGKSLSTLSFLLVGIMYLCFLGMQVLNSRIPGFLGKLPVGFVMRWGMTLACFATMLLGFRGAVVATIAGVLVIVFGFLDFVVPYLGRGSKTWLEAIHEAEETEMKLKRLPDLFPSRWRLPFLFLPLAICLYTSVGEAGRLNASETKIYRVIQVDSLDYAVLRIYNGTAYCGAFDRQEKQLTSHYRGVPVSSLSWREEALGPLTRSGK